MVGSGYGNHHNLASVYKGENEGKDTTANRVVMPGLTHVPRVAVVASGRAADAGSVD